MRFILPNKVRRWTKEFWRLKKSLVRLMKEKDKGISQQEFIEDSGLRMKIDNLALINIESLRLQKDSLSTKIQGLYPQLRQSVSQFEFDQAERIFSELINLNRIGQTIEEITNKLSANISGIPTYLFGSDLLYEAYQKLGSIPTESILYASGNQFANCFAVERLIPLELESSGYGSASANLSFSTNVLIELEKYGSLLCCYFHMHPGRGIQSNHPSSIDLSTQATLETGNYPSIGGIFSRDGYLRFFSDKKPFKIVISGKEIVNVGKNSYKLVKE